MNTADMYWEDYEDQDASEFQYVGYTDYKGEQVLEPIKDLIAQVKEVRRQYGSSAVIRVYRSE